MERGDRGRLVLIELGQLSWPLINISASPLERQKGARGRTFSFSPLPPKKKEPWRSLVSSPSSLFCGSCVGSRVEITKCPFASCLHCWLVFFPTGMAVHHSKVFPAADGQKFEEIRAIVGPESRYRITSGTDYGRLDRRRNDIVGRRLSGAIAANLKAAQPNCSGPQPEAQFARSFTTCHYVQHGGHRQIPRLMPP